MQRWILAASISFVSILVLSPAQGQTIKSPGKPDLSGSWLLDTRKSNGGGLTSRPDVPIMIKHQDPEFRVVLSSESNGQSGKREFVYFTDGRGETNEATSILSTNPSATKPEDLRNKVTKSKTKWNGNKIVTRSRLRLDVAGRFVEFEQVDEWKLSEDGKVLTQTSRTVFQNSDGPFLPARTTDKKRVFNRI